MKNHITDIPGIADLLGESNRFSVTAGFDTNNDPSTTEISSAHSAASPG